MAVALTIAAIADVFAGRVYTGAILTPDRPSS